MPDPLPPAGTDFGDRVRAHLTDKRVIWLTTVGRDGTPQPNPVWFVWDGGGELLTYNRADSVRIQHVRRNPRLALHFNHDASGDDVVVILGSAAIAEDEPGPHEHPAYRAKYEHAMAQVSGTPEQFGVEYPVPMRVTIDKIRGW